MAAGTEGFTDTTGGQTHLGSLISKAIAARRFAEDERKLAEEKAKKAGYDSLEEIGVEKGYFFKAALKSKFGGSYLSGKKQDIKAAVDRVKLLKNPKAQFWNFVDNRDAEGKEIKKLNEVERFRKQFDNYAFVSAKRPPEKEAKAETPVVPKKMSPFDVAQSQKAVTQERMLAKTEEKTAKAASGGGGGRVSREDILTAVSAIASSLEKTAQSINNTIGETKVIADGVQAIKTDVVTQLSERTDSIEAKLDAIVAAINAQTALQEKMTDDAETSKSMAAAKQQGDAADSGDFDDVTTEVDESLDDKSDAELNLGEPSPAATSAQDIEFQQQDRYMPQAETGGIISGPDEGYLAKLHGDEMVIPLDNNYTQGQPSAMDGKVRPVPETPAVPKFETGTPSKPPATSSLGGKVGFTSLNLGMGSKSSSVADSMAQPLMDAMSLPMMVAGGTILSSVNQLITQLGPENSDVAGEVAKVARPIADVFGLPNNLVNKATGGMGRKEGDDKDGGGKRGTKDKKKGFFSNLFDKLKKLTTGGRRGGGGGGGGGDPGTSPNFTGEGGDMTMNYLMSQGLTKEQAAGVAGNLQQESTFNPRADNTGTGENDTEGHFGIAQWDKVHRWPKIKKWIVDQGLDPYSLEGQLQAMVWEAKQRGDWSKLKEVTDADAAARSWLQNFERSGEQPGDPGYDARIANARMWAEKELVTAGPTEPSPTPSSNSDAVTPETSQAVTQNFGMRTHDKMKFMHKGVLYEAYKTTKGFDLFKLGGNLFGGTPVPPSDPTHAAVLQSFLKTAREKNKKNSAANIQPPAAASGQTAASAATAQQQSLQPPERRRRTQGSTAGVARLNSERQSSSSTSKPPDSSSASVPEGSDNNLDGAYTSRPVTSS